MGQARCGDKFVRGIGLEIQRSKVQTDLARDGPDMDPVQCGRECFMVQPVGQAPELVQFRDFPQHDCRDTPLRICAEDVSLAWRDTSRERFDQNMSVQIQHSKQLQSKRDRPVDSRRGLS